MPQDLCNTKYDKLAMYNTEVARGIVHTPGWKEKMAALQSEYNNDCAQLSDNSLDKYMLGAVLTEE